MIDFLTGLWDPLANAAGIVFGALVAHLWIRFRNRVVELRWTSQTQRIASSGEDERFGRVEVRYNDVPVQNLFVVGINISNGSTRDLSKFEIQVGFRGGTMFLSGTAEIQGSLRTLHYSEDFADAYQGLLDTPEDERDQTLVRDIYQNRFFQVPALSRGEVVNMAFLVHADPGVTPRPLVFCDAPGVRVKEQPPKPQFLGVRQDVAGIVGLLIGVVGVGLLSIPFDFSFAAVLAAFVVGAFGQVIGVAAVQLKRIAGRILG